MAKLPKSTKIKRSHYKTEADFIAAGGKPRKLKATGFNVKSYDSEYYALRQSFIDEQVSSMMGKILFKDNERQRRMKTASLINVTIFGEHARTKGKGTMFQRTSDDALVVVYPDQIKTGVSFTNKVSRMTVNHMAAAHLLG